MNDDDEEAAAGVVQDDDTSDQTEVETKARAQRWVPLEEFRGNRDDWCDAAEWVRRGDPHYLRKELARTEKEMRGVKQRLDAEKRAFDVRLQRMEKMSQAQRGKLYADIEAARRTAVELGDTVEYDRLNRAEADLYPKEVEVAAADAPEPKKGAAEDVHPDVEHWVQANPWFLKDMTLNMAAQGIHAQLLKDEPSLTVTDNLAKTKKELMRRFPEKFRSANANKEPSGRTAVESGDGGRMSSQPRGKGWTDIPAEERQIIDRHIKEGLYKDKAEAAATYWS